MMKLRCLYRSCTIGQRVVLFSGLTVLVILALVSTYSYQLISLEKNLITLEQFDDLYRDILELRRYEKDILLQLGPENVQKARQSLQSIEKNIEQLTPKVSKKNGKKGIKEISSHFIAYKTTFTKWCGTETCEITSSQSEESQLIRRHGQQLVNDVDKLVRWYKKEIGQDFKEIMFWLTFMPVTIFIVGAVLLFTQTKGVISRLSSLRQATKDLAAGEFKVIPTMNTPSDEISTLITNFNQMVEALAQKQEELIQSKKMATIGTFSSGIAHEINNPLNNISLSTDTLLEEYSTMDEEEVKEILDDIMTQTERASNIVRNLLDFSRAQSSEMQPLYIDYVLHKTTELVANELRIHKISLYKDIADLLPRVNGDLQKLQQVFLNLIINAEQAIGDYGSISVRALETENGFIRTDICDTGPGIPPEILDQIFDPFFTTKEAGEGTGLGLAISYSIVKQHGGYIEVASKPGEGTTFSVYLPPYVEAKDEGGEDEEPKETP